jgi:hypothetical protein
MSRSFGRPFTINSVPVPKHYLGVHEIEPVKTLLVEDDSKTKKRILASILPTPTEVQCVPTLVAALSSLDRNLFDIIVIDRHLGGWISARSCKVLVDRAEGRPVVGLIDEDCVLDLRDGIEAGLTAVYYKVEMDFCLMRRLARLALLPSVETPLADAAVPSLRSARW